VRLPLLSDTWPYVALAAAETQMTESACIDPYSETALERAVVILRQGGIVAFPTETYYGLAADPFNHDALRRLYAIKKRTTQKPILTVINDREQLAPLVQDIPGPFQLLMDRFWPGPLTLVFKGNKDLPPLLTGYTGTIGVRWSSHPVACRLADLFDNAVTATSANLSGGKSAVTAIECCRYFGTDIDMVIDGGTTPGGRGSTLVGIENGRLRLLRDGVIPFAEVAAVYRTGS
jgi:L-threonylcarbamoyladenylate synthase